MNYKNMIFIWEPKYLGQYIIRYTNAVIETEYHIP